MDKLYTKRKELKQQISAGKYSTLVGWMLDKTGRALQKLLRKSAPPAYWISAMALGLLILLLRVLISLLIDPGPIAMHVFWAITLESVLVMIAVISLIALKAYDAFILRALVDNIIDHIELDKDLDDLRDWLTSVYSNKGKNLLFAIVTSTAVMAYVIYFWQVLLRMQGISYGSSVLFFLVLFQSGIYVYYVLLLADFSLRVRNYQFQLYKVAPGQSKIIDSISSIQTPLVYMTVIFATLSTAYFAIFNILNWSNTILALMGGWVPLSVLFLSNQIGLGEIIRQAKQRTLYELQAEIDQLHLRETPPSKVTLEHIRALVDYYEFIRAKPDSALNLRAVLGYLNNLLLPLLGVLLANLDKLAALIP